jgi:hypothetical protein
MGDTSHSFVELGFLSAHGRYSQDGLRRSGQKNGAVRRDLRHKRSKRSGAAWLFGYCGLGRRNIQECLSCVCSILLTSGNKTASTPASPLASRWTLTPQRVKWRSFTHHRIEGYRTLRLFTFEQISALIVLYHIAQSRRPWGGNHGGVRRIDAEAT